jgi:hypothetical protein
MKLTRRQLVAGAGAAALGAAGIYELVDRLSTSSTASAAGTIPLGGPRPPEQHVLDGIPVVVENGVEVIVPPRHHLVVTATLKDTDLVKAKKQLEDALLSLESRYEQTPAGLGVTVAWGLPYFERFVPAAFESHVPHDRRADKPALLATRTFPSDPDGTILERNDVALLIRSDRLDHIEEARKTLLDDLGVFEPASLRRGFVGGDLPRKLAIAAGVPGAYLVPHNSELFLGFTSTQKAGLGPRRIANFETLGLVDLRGGYFRGGTHMHLSHIFEDLEAWYLNFDFQERVDTAFRPGLKVPANAQVVPQGPKLVSSAQEVTRTFDRIARFGHSASIQTSSRLLADHVGDDGTLYVKGTAIPQRADFNTLDNPFAWSADPKRDQLVTGAAAGVHFVVFNPSSDDFHRNRLAMDGVLPDGTTLKLQPQARGQGFNSVLKTTHRQNFLVPPRRHRSFPLAEL